MTAVSGAEGLAAVKEIFPVPEAGRPMAGLELVHSNTAPAVPLKAMLTF
jgi:hypothetical protein